MSRLVIRLCSVRDCLFSRRIRITADLIILLTVFLHIGEGVTIVVTPAANETIALDALLEVFRYSYAAAVVLIAAGALALIAQWSPGIRPVVRFTMFLPQWGLLIVTALGVLSAIIASQYVVGMPRPRIFIFWDQCGRVAIMPIVYMAAIYVRVVESDD